MQVTEVRTDKARAKPEPSPFPTPELAGSALTIVTPIVAGQEASLKTLLEEIGTHIKTNSYIPFARLETVHFLRWVVIPANSASEPALLAFECNHDGTRQALLEELFAKASRGMHAIYAHCTGYEAVQASPSRALVFLLEHAIPYSAFYVAVPGASVRQIRGERAIRERIESFLDERGPAMDARALYQGALERVRKDTELSAVLDNARDSFPFRPLRLTAGLGAALVALPALLPALVAIRVQELFDQQTPSLSIPDQARALMAKEDLQIQNQLTHVVPLRPGPLRATSVRVALGVINFLAHELFTRGNLGGITSIHFARWVLIDNGRRLLFFSNYDGSWESYLGDFIDKASLGLTSVWSNTQEFPKAWFLLFKGATDEERFKAWTRAHQIPTQLWYSAYPDLTVHNILNNKKICAGLRRGLHRDRDLRRWLQRF
jgi:hypothetical protein